MTQGRLLGWNACDALARKLAAQVRASGYRPEIIVAIGRGGWFAGRVLSDALGQPDLTSFRIEHYRDAVRMRAARVRYPLAADVAGRRVLLVDDVADSGETFVVAVEHLRRRGDPAEVRSAVLHYKTSSPYVPDYCASRQTRWRWIIYPWAVSEDIGGLVRKMTPRPGDCAELARRLADEHGLRVPRRLLPDLLES